MTHSAGEVVREVRQRARLTQTDLAGRAGLTQSVISAYESGHRQPSVPTLARLLAAAGYELDLGFIESTSRLTGPIGTRVHQARRRIRDIAEDQDIDVLGIFGSVARGEDRPDSDVDLLVDISRGASLLSLGRLTDALEDLLGTTVDVVPADGLKDDVRERITADLVRL